MIAWALILILAGNSLGGESSIELSQIRDITHAPEAVDQPSISQHHSNQVELTSLPDLTPSNHEVTITIDDEEGSTSRAAPETESHTPTALARTIDPQYTIIPVGLKKEGGSLEGSSQGRPDCPICLDQCSEPYCQLVKCKHYFCTSCIDQWLEINPHCPVCRAGPEELPRSNEATLTQSVTVQAIIQHMRLHPRLYKLLLGVCFLYLVVLMVLTMMQDLTNVNLHI
ncbi:hypothetical protein PGT21_021139 [Puccinia graminis f. sp. tritici]|uniref:RING-type domain-containing protein n=1 Tax=Puccinia graminis f. sp. tritici TaxID=56615 RepID=A0A5B0M335_PUCGR|nr:hypothetical protein PGT21_021139 [Puccinia graminis f. sp. tritici]KAA1125776.1 hypothetical protein PGTUg99_019037 [Puccinia graminis f. sp. tritici]